MAGVFSAYRAEIGGDPIADEPDTLHRNTVLDGFALIPSTI